MAEVVKRRHWYGDVVSNKMQKTVVVVVSTIGHSSGL